MSSGRYWAVQTASITLPCFTPIVTGKSIANELPSSTGCLPTAPFEGLEPDAGKLARPVLRCGRRRKTLPLPDHSLRRFWQVSTEGALENISAPTANSKSSMWYGKPAPKLTTLLIASVRIIAVHDVSATTDPPADNRFRSRYRTFAAASAPRRV